MVGRCNGCTDDNDDAEVERDDELTLVEERLRNTGNAGAAKEDREARVMAHDLLIQTGAAAVPRRAGRSGAIELVTSPRADVDVQSGSFQYLVQCIREAQRELLRLHRSILKGTDLDVPQNPVLQSHGLTVSELINAFLSDPRMQGVSAKRRTDYAMVFRVLREAWGGEKHVRELSREDFRVVRRLLRSIPKNSTKFFPGMSFRDAAIRASERGVPLLNPKTVATHLQKISTLFKWAENEDYIDRNLARGLADRGSSAHSDEDRHPFTVEELQRIFSGPPFVRGREKSNTSSSIESGQGGARYWVPLIGLFHGMRLNEICQLRIDQIKQHGEISYFDIQASSADQRLKTSHSRRRIPVHPTVASLGFLRYVSELRQRGEDRLFPELPVDARGYYSRKITRWFSSYVAKCGVDTERKSFHSLRHAWRDAAREARIPEEIVKVLGGWVREGTAARYGSGYSLEVLNTELSKIEFRGLNLGSD